MPSQGPVPYKIFPQNGRQLLTGGLKNKYGANIIANHESPDCLNVVFDSGCVSTRPGTTQVNTTSVGTFVCDGLYSYRNNAGAESMVVWFGGSAYSLSGTTLFTIPSAQSVFTAGIRVASEQAENYIFFSNGSASSNPYKYNGAFTRHGVPAPTQTLTVASNGVGALTASGNYTYTYTYVNTNVVEGNVGPISTTFVISSTSGQNTVSGFGTSPVSFGANNMYLYRTKANTTTPYYRVTTLAAGAASFNDNVSDTSLSVQGPTNNGQPPNYTTIVYAQTYLFCNDSNNPNYVWYSNAANPYTFPTTNFFRVGDNTSDTVQGLYYYNGAIIVFCEKSVSFIYLTDQTPGDWIGPIRSTSPYGSKSPYALVPYENKILFPAMWNQKFVGFAAFSGNVLDTNKTFLTVASTGSDLKSDGIEPDMYSLNVTEIANFSALVYKKKAWITVSYGAGQLTNNRVYQMDFSMSTLQVPGAPPIGMTWCPFTGINAAQFCIYQGTLYYGDSTATGFIYRCETGNYNDNGNAINSYVNTKEFVGIEGEEVGGSDTNVVKNFRYVNVLYDTEGSYNMNMTYWIDSDKGVGNTATISLDPGGSKWGSMIWGTGSWGGGSNQVESRVYLGTARGRRIKFQFSNQNTANQLFSIYGLNLAYIIQGYR